MLESLSRGVRSVRALGTILWCSDAEFTRMYAQRVVALPVVPIGRLRAHWDILYGVRQLSKLSAYLIVPISGTVGYCVGKSLANRTCGRWSPQIGWLSGAVVCGVTLQCVKAYIVRRMRAGEMINADVHTILNQLT